MDTREIYAKLEDSFVKWFPDQNQFQIADYTHAFGDAKNALLHCTVFLPQLIELDGSVLLLQNIESKTNKAEFLEHARSQTLQRSELEAQYNFVEVGYQFGPAGRTSTDQEDLLLAQIMRMSWSAWLGYQYPNRKFKVDILSPEVTGSTVGLTFSEIR